MHSKTHPDQLSLAAKVADSGTKIPDKLYFKIGEVCDITGVKQHALRYWESEFSIIKPQRARSKQRLYRRVDVENILKIKKLLHEEGFTISGAKKHLAKVKTKSNKHHISDCNIKSDQLYKFIKSELIELKQLLEK